jgi:hypothetical protein
MPLVLNSSSISGLASVGGLSSPQSNSVLQVVNAVYGTYTTLASSTYTDTGLTASITPKFATSKIVVQVTIAGAGKGSQNLNNALFLRLLRDGSTIYYMDETLGYTGTTISQNSSSAFSYLDSPSTTSSIVYNIQMANYNNGSIVWINNYSANAGRTNSTLTLWEIAA